MQVLTMLAAQAPPPGGPGGGGGGLDMLLIWLVPIFLIFFLMWRSNKKKDQERKDMLARIAKGDHVITIGGLHGEVARLNEREVVLMVDKSKGVELKFQRTAIHGLQGPKGEGEKGSESTQEGGSKA